MAPAAPTPDRRTRQLRRKIDRELPRGELLAVIFIVVLGGTLIFSGPGMVLRLIGMWSVVLTALFFVVRDNGPIMREIRSWFQRSR